MPKTNLLIICPDACSICDVVATPDNIGAENIFMDMDLQFTTQQPYIYTSFEFLTRLVIQLPYIQLFIHLFS